MQRRQLRAASICGFENILSGNIGRPKTGAVRNLRSSQNRGSIACDMTRRPPSQSAEDYLERIYELIQEKGFARVADIASSLKVRQASVTAMVQKLARRGFLKYERYHDVIMTAKGREVARRIQDRHKTLSRFFSLLGLDAATQRDDIEGIEHHLSQTTVNVLSDLALFFEKHPQTLKSFLQSRNGAGVRHVKRKT